MLLVGKTKCLNSSNMSDICHKLNFITNDTFTRTDTNFIKQHIYVTIVDITTERPVKEFPLQFTLPPLSEF